jgi:hypothetical protein
VKPIQLLQKRSCFTEKFEIELYKIGIAFVLKLAKKLCVAELLGWIRRSKIKALLEECWRFYTCVQQDVISDYRSDD